MKRGRGRPPKTPVHSSKLLKSTRRGSQHGGQTSRVCLSQLGEGIKTRESNRSTPRRSYFEGIQFSDSDSDSDSSYSSSVSSVRSYKIPRVIAMKTVAPLPLPPSSDDIILPPEHVLQGLGIYEVLRQFGRNLRLSPFRFEDFCAAIDSPEQSALLSQIHMALFRALLQEDETNGYTFAASDEKDSLNIFLHEVDCFTWPEHIRSYFFSDKAEFGDLFDTIKGRDPQEPFPFVSISDRLKVLQRLCDLFLASNTVREVIINEGIVESEDHCRNCSKMGDLLCCETCPAVYHLHCLKPPLEVVPEGDWLCPICDQHQLRGVTDCQPVWIKDGWLRHTPLGTDRQGRKYWFLSRRLFVESEDELVLYYSSKAHLDELIEYLEEDGQERRLLSAIKTKYNTIIKQMAITESLIEASRGDLKSGLLARRKKGEKQNYSASEADLSSTSAASPIVDLTFVPDTAVAKIVTKTKEEAGSSTAEPIIDRRTAVMEQRKEALSSDQPMCDFQSMEGNKTSEVIAKDDSEKTATFMEDMKEECTTSTTAQPGIANERPFSPPQDMNNSCLPVKTFESTGNPKEITVKSDNEGLKKNDRISSSEATNLQEAANDSKNNSKIQDSFVASNRFANSEQQKAVVDDIVVKGPFFRLGMENNFSDYVNHFATDPLALNRLQHMENKERRRAVSNKFSVFNEFKVSGEIFGPKDVILNTLRCSIVNLENNIPAAFMHPAWPIQRSTWVRAVHMSTTPGEFAAALCFLESLIKPVCFLPVWNDSLGHTELHRAIVETKAEKKKREHKEDEEDVDYRDRVFVNYSWIPIHQIWKQKGEEYRIFGGGGWTWESEMSSPKRKHHLTKDKEDFECKKQRLCTVVDNFVKRQEKKKMESERKAKAKLAVAAYKAESILLSKGAESLSATSTESIPTVPVATSTTSLPMVKQSVTTPLINSNVNLPKTLVTAVKGSVESSLRNSTLKPTVMNIQSTQKTPQSTPMSVASSPKTPQPTTMTTLPTIIPGVPLNFHRFTQNSRIYTSPSPQSTSVASSPQSTAPSQPVMSPVPQSTTPSQPVMSPVPQSTAPSQPVMSPVPQSTAPSQPVMSSVPQSTAPSQPVMSPVPQSTAPSQPVMSSVPQSTAPSQPVMSPVPQSTAPSQPVMSPVPQSTAPSQPVMSPVPQSTAPSQPVMSPVPQSTVPSQPVMSSVPQSTAPSQPVMSSVPQSTAPSQPVMSSVPQSTAPSQPVMSPVPQSTAPSQPVMSPVPQSTAPSQPVMSPVPQSTAPSQPVMSSVPQSTAPSQPVMSSVPQSTAPSQPVMSSVPQSTAPSQPVMSSVPQSTAPSQPVMSPVPQSTAPSQPVMSPVPQSTAPSQPVMSPVPQSTAPSQPVMLSVPPSTAPSQPVMLSVPQSTAPSQPVMSPVPQSTAPSQPVMLSVPQSTAPSQPVMSPVSQSTAPSQPVMSPVPQSTAPSQPVMSPVPQSTAPSQPVMLSVPQSTAPSQPVMLSVPQSTAPSQPVMSPVPQSTAPYQPVMLSVPQSTAPSQPVMSPVPQSTAPSQPVMSPVPQSTAPSQPVMSPVPQSTVPSQPVTSPVPQSTVPSQPVMSPVPQSTAPSHPVMSPVPQSTAFCHPEITSIQDTKPNVIRRTLGTKRSDAVHTTVPDIKPTDVVQSTTNAKPSVEVKATPSATPFGVVRTVADIKSLDVVQKVPITKPLDVDQAAPDTKLFEGLQIRSDIELSHVFKTTPDTKPCDLVQTASDIKLLNIVQTASDTKPLDVVQTVPDSKPSGVAQMMPDKKPFDVVQSVLNRKPSDAVQATSDTKISDVVQTTSDTRPFNVVQAASDTKMSSMFQAVLDTNQCNMVERMPDTKPSNIFETKVAIKPSDVVQKTCNVVQENIASEGKKVLIPEPVPVNGQSTVSSTSATLTQDSTDSMNKNATKLKTLQTSSNSLAASATQCTSSVMSATDVPLGHCVSMGSGLKETPIVSKVVTQPARISTMKPVSHSHSNSSKAPSSASLRAIAPQPRPTILPATLQPGAMTGAQGTTQITIPIVQGNVMQGTNVLKVTTPVAANSGTPVSNIAALVASLPANMVSSGQPQLIRFVTPSGATITLQGTIQPQPTGKAATISVPKTILTNQLPSSAQTTRPVPVAPKTVGACTGSRTVTLARPQQPSAAKTPKSIMEQKDKYPMLEAVVKDPRKLLDRQMSKWRQNRYSMKSVYQLPKHKRRVFGRRGGMKEMSNFMYVTRGSGVSWAAGFPRPNFKVAWRYRSQSLRTLAGAGLQARILHACLKWEDMNVRPPRSNSSTICTSTGTTTTEIINHRYVTPDGLHCEFLVRKIVRNLHKPVAEAPRPPPPTVSKRGRILRPKINLNLDDDDEEEVVEKGPRVFETWCPEEKLELWEIRQYHERKERERALEREKKIQEEALKRAAELRAAAIERKQLEQQAKQQQQIMKKKVQNAIKTQQRKLTNVNQAVSRSIVNTAFKTVVTTLPNTSQVLQTSVSRQPLPRITSLVSQYRPSSLSQPRVPIGSPATVVRQVVTKPQINYRPLATTVQSKPTVSTGTKVLHTLQPIIRSSSSTNHAPKMKHSSKELQQAKQQIAKAKSKKSGGGGAMNANRKVTSLESRQDMNRMAACHKAIDYIISKIERNEELERQKEAKRKAVLEKQERAKAIKLDAILYKRKEMLKKEIIRKRSQLERELTIEVEKELEKEQKSMAARKRKRDNEGVTEPAVNKKQKTEELYCVCRKPYDETKFYIGCDLCANWFHGSCVGVTPEQAASMDDFTCMECSKAQKGVEKEELYCLCKQPYDETKFYIGCDTCHDWFHGTCVGVSEYQATFITSYMCPRCKESQSQRDVQPLTKKNLDSLKRLLKSLQSHKMAWPFLEPVNGEEVVDYYDVIKDPMDLSKVEDRLTSNYYKTLEQFNNDITTIFDNCRLYNPKESPYYRCAEVLEGFFVKKLRSWR